MYVTRPRLPARRGTSAPCGCPTALAPRTGGISAGRLSAEPIEGARELPGGWVLPGLVDAHAHLTLDFAGVDSIEHGPLLDADLLEQVARQGSAWTPTLWTVVGVTERLAAAPGPLGGIAREVLARLRAMIPLAADLGVPVLAGGDEAPHGALVQEVARLRQFGLTPADAIAAASTSARAYLGLPTLAPGAPADLVTFAADPRSDLRALARPAAVVFDGRRIV